MKLYVEENLLNVLDIFFIPNRREMSKHHSAATQTIIYYYFKTAIPKPLNKPF